MNKDEVRSALNVNKLNGPWEDCTDAINYTTNYEGTIALYPILKQKYRLLFYSGDTDGVVGTLGSKRWI